MIANHGQSVQYIHDDIGVNSRLDSIQAAVLRVKLRELDQYASARNKAADYYDKAFAHHPKIKTPVRAKNSTHVFHQYTLTLNGVDRDKMKEFLSDKNIPAMIYYPKPLHRQTAYRDFPIAGHGLPVSERLAEEVLSLPMHPYLDAATQDHIVTTLISIMKAHA